MFQSRIRFLLALCALVTAVANTSALAADAYPSRVIKLVVPYPPGSTTDTVARLIAAAATETLGQPVIVDNRGGAGGNIGAQAVARAAPDGYTLLMTNGSVHGINSALFRNLPFDPIRDFQPITQLTLNSYVLLLNKDVPANSVAELLALARSAPGKLNIGAGASSSQFAGEMLKQMAGVDMTYISYKGNAQAMTDLIGGHVQVMMSDMSAGMAQVRAGSVKALATSGVKRANVAPELPTLQEAGVKGYQFSGWVGVAAPAKTPRPIIDRLHAAIREAMSRPDVLRLVTAGGAEVVLSSPEQFSAFIKDEIDRAAAVAKSAHIQPEQ